MMIIKNDLKLDTRLAFYFLKPVHGSFYFSTNTKSVSQFAAGFPPQMGKLIKI
jgi:hypothetical protein